MNLGCHAGLSRRADSRGVKLKPVDASGDREPSWVWNAVQVELSGQNLTKNPEPGARSHT